MSRELRTVTVTVTVLDSEHLPHGITQDGVTEEVKEVVSEAVDLWWNLDGGLHLLACEPEVT